MKRPAAVVVSLLIVSSLFAVGTFAAESSTSDGVTEINSCTVIESLGTYVLTEDIENSSTTDCINIRSSDVVLDDRATPSMPSTTTSMVTVTRAGARTNSPSRTSSSPTGRTESRSRPTTIDSKT